MKASRIVLAAAVASLAALAGCQSERFSSLNTRQATPAPAPLAAAPTGQVQSSQLPPPSAPGTAAGSQFPTAPGAAEGTDTQLASLPPQGGASISAGSVAGVWNATVAGQGCRVATPQTRFGQGFRAGPLRCPAPLDGVKSWNVSGSQLVLYDENGSALANLYQSGDGRFDGQTTTGQPVSLSR